MNIILSTVNNKDGKTFAYLRFEDGKDYAEGIIPDCTITKSSGFSEDEIKQMENYMKDNLATLKKQAAQINPIKSMMND